jgi:hypothetical protein
MVGYKDLITFNQRTLNVTNQQNEQGTIQKETNVKYFEASETCHFFIQVSTWRYM